MDSVLKLTIPGRPLIWQRPKAMFKGGRMWKYDPQKTEREMLSALLLEGRQRSAVYSPIDGPLSINVAFFLAQHGKRKVDLSNMLKAIEDSGNRILWVDDDQIIHVNGWKHYCEPAQERTEIEVIKC